MNLELTVVSNASASRSPSPKPPKSVKSKKKKKTPPTSKKPRGWGPFQSVLKERSVDFNLTLDVQNLQQQVQDLTTLRDLLSAKTALRRHSPEGSLFQVVKEYFHVFRAGWAVHESGRKRLLGDQDQRDFLNSIMDAEVDVGNGLRGPDVMADQIVIYSTFIKFIQTTMQSYEIIVAEDTVVVKTQARLKFQVLRKTIEMIFPHIIGDEWFVAQLVGQELEPPIGITFFFNAVGKCCRYKMDLDFVEAFSSIVKDPRKLDILLGKALIADNCMFGIIDEPPVPKEQNLRLGLQGALEDERDRLVEQLSELQSLTSINDGVALGPSPYLTSSPLHVHSDMRLLKVVNDYYAVFEKGYRDIGNQSHPSSCCSQADFISQAFVPETPYTESSGKYVYQRWRALSECFNVLGFHPKSVLSIEYEDQEDMCTVRSVATYLLRIDLRTLEFVFPHVLPYRELVDALVGNILEVSSQLTFFIETDSGRISYVVERMDFVKAMTALLPNKRDVSFVMSHAQLSLDGVACHEGISPQSVSAILPLSSLDSAWIGPASTKSAANARTMTMADILSS